MDLLRRVTVSSHKSLLGITGTSGSDETTLVRQFIARFVHGGRRVISIRHTHHGSDLDSPDKDSHRMREADGVEIVPVGDEQPVLIREYVSALEPRLDDVLTLFSPATDLVIVEGYKRSIFPKIKISRPSLGRPPLWPAIDGVVAVATDLPGAVQPPEGAAVPNLNDVDAVYRFAIQQLVRSVM